MGGAVGGVDQRAFAGTPALMDETSAAALQEVTAAQQAQLEQQLEFQKQVRQYDNMQRAKAMDGSTLLPTGRVMKGYRPMQLCKKLINMGSCPRGDDCTFAHAVEELHPASLDIPEDQRADIENHRAEEEHVDDLAGQIPQMRMKKIKEMCHRKD